MLPPNPLFIRRSVAALVRFGSAALALLLAAAPLSAQTLRGRVVDPQGAGTVRGAHVLLLDAAGDPVASAFTDEGGLFVVRATAAGLHRVRIELIGRQSRTSDAFVLEVGETLELALELPYEPISLDGLQIESDARCERVDQAGLATARLWEEARKALSAQVASRGGGYRFGVEHYVREVDERGTTVADDRRYRTVAAIEPFASRPADTLVAAGFLQDTPDGRILYAPDAAVLLSDAFLDTHCFTARRVEAGLVALDFEPVAGRTLPDVAGTLLLDESTATLRSLEFRYVQLPPSLRNGRYGGSASFEPLQDGRWIIREWSIRTPLIGIVDDRFRDLAIADERVVGVQEEGGTILGITAPDGSQRSTGARGVLAGTVYDSSTARPLAGAEVRIVGTAWRAIADKAGAFRIADLPVGRYRLEFAHPRLSEVDHAPQPVQVEVAASDSAHVRLGIPLDAVEIISDAQLARLDTIVAVGRAYGLPWAWVLGQPRLQDPGVGAGAVVGQVIDQQTGGPIADARIALEGTTFEALTDARGRFRLPAVPIGDYTLVATMLGYARRETNLEVPEGQTVEAIVPFAAEAIALDPIEVAVRSPALARAGFYDRRDENAGGHFITRADIERRNPRALSDLLAAVPGVRLLRAGVGRTTVRFNREVSGLAQGAMPPGCEPDVYLDGVRMADRITRNPSEVRLGTIDLVSPDAIEAVEVFVGSDVPIQYNSACGVVLIWTRRGG